MVIDTNAVTNLPGLENRKMDNLIALRAACQVAGQLVESSTVEPYVDEFTRWLKDAHSTADRLVRRYVLLTVTEGRSSLASSGRDAADVSRAVDKLYRKVC